MRARVVNSVDDLLPYRPVVLHLSVFPLVPDAVGVRGVFDHGDGPRALCKTGVEIRGCCAMGKRRVDDERRINYRVINY